MATVSWRDLSRRSGDVVEEVVRNRRPALVTRHGRPVVALIPIEDEALEDVILAHAPEFVEGRREAEADLTPGDTKSLTSFLAESLTAEQGHP